MRRDAGRHGELLMICSIEGCDNEAESRGWCVKHWTRWRRHGDPTVTRREWTKREHATCVVPGCGRPSHAKGWCDLHAYRVRTHGSPHVVQRIRNNPIERLLSYVQIDLPTGCWRYTGTLGPGGYGRMNIASRGPSVPAHRAAHEFWIGPIAEGLEVDHVWAP